MVAHRPGFYRGKHTNMFLPPYFIIAAGSMMRGSRLPRRLQQIFSSQQQTCTLRPPDDLPTTISHNVCAITQMHIRECESFGSSINKNRNSLRLGNLRYIRHTEGRSFHEE